MSQSTDYPDTLNVIYNGFFCLYEPALKERGGILRSDIDEAVEFLQRNGTCFIHYVIKSNVIYGKGYGKWQVRWDVTL